MDQALIYEPEKPVRNDLYYLETVIFLVGHSSALFCEVTESRNLTQVEDNLFRVPTKHFLSGSDFFGDILVQVSSEHDGDGLSDDKPIRLSNVTRVDFERLLGLMYPT